MTRDVILTALDDNADAWYGMLVPFLLSLRRTDFAGAVGVIDYGLSPAKREVLEKLSVLRVAALRKAELASDRFLSASHFVATHPEVEQVAVFDADIWFPSRHLSIFDRLDAPSLIHACPDQVLCEFVFSPIRDTEAAKEMRRQVRWVADTMRPLQAGLLAGDRKAWLKFGPWLAQQLELRGDALEERYGLDTTLLFLYAAHAGVRLLDAKHNAVPHWGLTRSLAGDSNFLLEGRPVEGLHMIGEARHYAYWRYADVRRDEFLEGAEAFAVSPKTWRDVTLADSESVVKLPGCDLHFSDVRTSGEIERTSASGIGGDGAAAFRLVGDADMTITTSQPVHFSAKALSIGNCPRHDAVHFDLPGQSLRAEFNVPVHVSLNPGFPLRFHCEALDPRAVAFLCIQGK